MKKILSLLLTLALLASLAAPVAAAETAAVMRLTKTEGTVSVSKSNGKALSLRDDMRLYNGYNVTTEAKSYAWINLDSSKLMKLDASTSVEVRKNGSKLEVNVKSGSVSFDVSEKLSNNESLNVSTSTMTVGIRGTCGWVQITDQWVSEICLLEGSAQCVVADPVTSQVKSARIDSGDIAQCVVYSQDRAGDKCDILMGKQATEGIPGFVLTELVQNVALCDRILDDSGLDVLADLAAAAGGDPSGRTPDGKSASPEVQGQAKQQQNREEAETARKQEEIQKEADSQENNISQSPVWEQSQQPSPSSPSSPDNSGSGGSGNGGGNNTPSTGPSVPPSTGPEDPSVPDDPEDPEDPEDPSVPDTPDDPAPPANSGPPYTISFDLNNGPSTVSTPKSVTTDEEGKTTLPALDYEGPNTGGTLAFAGWADADGNPVTNSTVFTSNQTVYAQWTGWDWECDVDRGILRIFGTGAMNDFSGTGSNISTPWYMLSGSITSIVVEDGITRIGNYAFAMTQAARATIPASVGSIGEHAFDNCSKLTDIYFGGTRAQWNAANPGNQAVVSNDCSIRCTDGYLPVTVTLNANGGSLTLDGNALSSIDLVANQDGKLTTLPTPTANTGTLTFARWADANGNTVTSSTVFTEDTTVYAQWTGWGWELNDGTLRIFGNGAMADYVGGDFADADSAPWIGNGVQQAVIEDGITNIGNYAFSNCTGLTTIKIPAGVTSIGNNAFFTCTSLTSIEIPSGVTSIGSYAFWGCDKLTSITFGGTSEDWASISANASIPAGVTITCTGDATP